MIQVVIARNVYEPDSWTRASVSNVYAYLMQQFEVWPDTARIYHNYIALDHDVTPTDLTTLQALQTLEGVLFVVVYPAQQVLFGPVGWWALNKAIEILIPLPSIPASGQQAGSTNNELSSRTNRARVLGRIPDIFGTVRSTPDLIAPPYKIFENNVEVEHCLMCIGRGAYEVTQVRDGDTSIAQIAGASVSVYAPGVDIVTGTPQLLIGDDINTVPLVVTKSNAMNGQTLPPPNTSRVAGEEVYLQYPNRIRRRTSSTLDLGDSFAASEQIVLSGATFGADNFDGTYSILSVTEDEILLSNPDATNATWENLVTYASESTASFAKTLTLDGSLTNYVGWVVLSQTATTGAVINFYAPSGLYSVSAKGGQFPFSVTVQIEYQQIDSNDVGVGTVYTHSVTLAGKRGSRDAVGKTVQINLPFSGRCQMRFLRITPIPPNEFDGDQVISDVKVRDLYAYTPIQKTIYDNVTLVRSRTFATDGALSVKERKLNMLVTRKLPTFDLTTGLMTNTLVATTSAADAIASVCFDAQIGRRTPSEVDLANIYQCISDVAAYFGTSSAADFCYTFDSTNQSFEEIVTTIAQAVFCEAYRQGNMIRLSFEQATNDSVLLFNHRNKVPKSEKRTLSFGIDNSHDGVEYTWIDPADDAKVTVKVPTDGITNAKKIESIGVRNARQAHFSAWRAWNKLRYQRESVEFDALRESDLLVRKDRVLIADNTRTGTQDGEIETQVGLIVTTSQPCEFTAGQSYTMHLQLYDGSVDAIGCSAGIDPYHVVLSRPAALPLVLDSDRYVRTVYMLVSDTDTRAKAFLLGEKSMAGRMTNTLKLVNYDHRYYQNDTDFINGVIA